MKRFAHQSGASTDVVPTDVRPVPGTRSLFKITPSNAGCWACSDTPCASFASTEVSRSLPFDVSRNPDTQVCPTGALSIGADGQPAVDEAECIGCGLCVVRCPVGAIHVNPETMIAKIAGLATGAVTGKEEFEATRSAVATVMSWERPPLAYTDLATRQVERTEGVLAWEPPAVRNRATRLLVRNAFLVTGDAAALNNEGDSAPWAELLVAPGMGDGVPIERLGLVQIQPIGADLNAPRRLLAGSAAAIVASELAVEHLVPMIFVVRQPNARTDMYRIAADAAKYLNLDIKTLPMGMLYLALRTPESSLLGLIDAAPRIDGANLSNEAFALATFGPRADEVTGLKPAK